MNVIWDFNYKMDYLKYCFLSQGSAFFSQNKSGMIIHNINYKGDCSRSRPHWSNFFCPWGAGNGQLWSQSFQKPDWAVRTSLHWREDLGTSPGSWDLCRGGPHHWDCPWRRVHCPSPWLTAFQAVLSSGGLLPPWIWPSCCVQSGGPRSGGQWPVGQVPWG